jgi:hypothetical protein
MAYVNPLAKYLKTITRPLMICNGAHTPIIYIAATTGCNIVRIKPPISWNKKLTNQFGVLSVKTGKILANKSVMIPFLYYSKD